MNEPSSRADRAAHDVIGAAIEVHRVLGAGFLEGAYEVALMHELGLRGIPVQRQVPIQLAYKGISLGEYRIDLLVDRILVVELKAVSDIVETHVAQTIAYLRAANVELGLILNFARPALRDRGIRRIVRS
jgi:GxxExxY protein